MAVAPILLGLLEAGPRHGYDLKQRYDRLFGRRRPLKFGQVYATLSRLSRDGLVRMEAVERGSGPDRKRYGITGEGAANLDAYRTLGINFLNTADNQSSSLFTTLNNTTAAYDTRVRGMVSMLMTLQRFQEQ